MEENKNINPIEDFNWEAYESGETATTVSHEEQEKAYDSTLNKVSDREVVDGKVIAMNKREVVVNIGYKSDGIIPLNEFRYNPDLKVGDIVEVDGFLGTISEIGIRTTSIIDNAGNVKIFNNSSMKDILNHSLYDSVAVVDIELPEDADIEAVTSADYGDIKCLGLEEILSDTNVIRFIKETKEADLYDERRKMNVKILKVLKELGIK